LNEKHLDHSIFPLGDLTKPEVRALAIQKGVHVANKKDSVGICFIGDINVHEFLKERLGEKPGNVVDTKGNKIGTHSGLWFYTIGQRHGFTIQNKTLIHQSDGRAVEKDNIPPFYVIGKKSESNQLIVGFGADTYFSSFTVESIHWISNKPETEKLLVRIRHTGQLLDCQLSNNTVTLAEPTQGIAEGQSAVFYEKQGDEVLCLGGGIISNKFFNR
jgi:tRNA-specific 2-thiouridylase